MATKLLTRDAFRAAVFARDGGLCVACKATAQDAHHIIERRLWPDGGYYLDNGASVCGRCHLECERTNISVERVRELAGINRIVLPEHLYHDQLYDKWGNIILQNGMRLRGELFYDESVQKVLAESEAGLEVFSDLVKYPRTYHLPFSGNVTDDDRVIPEHILTSLLSADVVVTEKMDGENTTMYRDDIHARSVDGRSHPSRDWVKSFWGSMRYNIPEGWRICGENMFAVHSIRYDDLESYFLGFSIWNEKNECLSWEDTLEWFGLLGIIPVPMIIHGRLGLDELKSQAAAIKTKRQEGFVVRSVAGFQYGQFRNSVAKYVRQNHVQTIKHWMHGQRLEANKTR